MAHDIFDPLIDYFDRVTQLFLAGLTGNAAKMEDLLKQAKFRALLNRGVNSQGDHTPLFFACYGGDDGEGASAADTVDVMLKNGANPFARDNVKRVPLHVAANSRDPAVIGRILAVTGMSLYVNDKAESGRTPFHALFLPGCGANGGGKPKKADLAKSLGLLLAASNRPLKSLIEKDNDGLSAAMLAKHYGLLAVFDTIDPVLKAQLKLDEIVLPANIAELLEQHEFFGLTPLIAAAFQSSNSSEATKENKELIRQHVLANSPELMVPNKQSGDTPLALACRGSSDGETVAMIISAPVVDPNHPDAHKRTPAHKACNTGRIDTVSVLLNDPRVVDPAVEGDINRHVDDQGKTLLDAVAMAGSRATVTKDELAQYEQADIAAAATGQEKPERLSQREKVIDLLFAKGISTDNAVKALELARSRDNKVVAARIDHNLTLRVMAEQEAAAKAALAAASRPGLIVSGVAPGASLGDLLGAVVDTAVVTLRAGSPKPPV